MRREHLFGRCPAVRVTEPRMEEAVVKVEASPDSDRPPAPAQTQGGD